MSAPHDAIPTPGRPSAATAPRVAFVLDLAKALHTYGMPAHRLETMVGAVGERLGLPMQLFTTPTAIFAAFGMPPVQQTYLVTPAQGEVDLGRLAELDEVVQEVADGETPVSDGSARVTAIIDAPARYRWPVRLLAHAVLSASAALLLGGAPRDGAAAAALGLAIGLLETLALRSEPVLRLMLPFGAFLAAFGAGVATLLVPALRVQLVGIAAIILLVPGLTFTTAMNEVATGHLVSGTARLSKAFLAFLLLGFGAALGSELADQIPGVTEGTLTAVEHPWMRWVGLALSLPALVVLLSARVRDAGWIAAATVVAYAAGFASALATGPEVGASAATVVVGLLGNAFARFRNRPAALLIVPGILLLVPGSLGFRAVSSFLREDVLLAVGTAFDVVLVAVALVAGLLLANLALPPKKAL